MSSTATRKFAHLTYAWERATNGKGKGGGSADRKQKQYYAGMVTERMTGAFFQDDEGKWKGVCPLTGLAFFLEFGEVDEVFPERGYHPGVICLVSKRGNQERGKMQANGKDLPGIARYTADVAKASKGIAIPRKCDAAPIVNSWGRTMNGDVSMNGPYGIV